jgi:hypothetical protein
MPADHFVFDTKETKVLINPSEIIHKEGAPSLYEDTSFYVIENDLNLDAPDIGWDIYPVYYLVVNKKSGFYYFPDPRKSKQDVFIDTLKRFKEPKMLTILSFEGKAEGAFTNPELTLKLSDGYELKQDVFKGEVNTKHNVWLHKEDLSILRADILGDTASFQNGISDNLKLVGSGVESDKVIQFFYAWKRGDYGKARPTEEQEQKSASRFITWVVVIILIALLIYKNSL